MNSSGARPDSSAMTRVAQLSEHMRLMRSSSPSGTTSPRRSCVWPAPASSWAFTVTSLSRSGFCSRNTSAVMSLDSDAIGTEREAFFSNSTSPVSGSSRMALRA